MALIVCFFNFGGLNITVSANKYFCEKNILHSGKSEKDISSHNSQLDLRGTP